MFLISIYWNLLIIKRLPDVLLKRLAGIRTGNDCTLVRLRFTKSIRQGEQLHDVVCFRFSGASEYVQRFGCTLVMTVGKAVASFCRLSDDSRKE